MSWRRGYDDGATYGDSLAQRQLDIAGARRQVYDQVIEVVPVGVVQQLFERAGHHRATPNHRRFLIDQVTD